jgi:hypothetical protein
LTVYGAFAVNVMVIVEPDGIEQLPPLSEMVPFAPAAVALPLFADVEIVHPYVEPLIAGAVVIFQYVPSLGNAPLESFPGTVIVADVTL